jgi:PBP1b-binding outer membrane lipoprotein LpoB
MKRIISLTLLAILFSSCANLETHLTKYPYTKADIAPIAIMTAGHTIDALVTIQAVGRGNREMLPILGEKPEPQKVAWYVASKTLFMVTLGQYLPQKWRTWMFGTSAVVSVGAAIYSDRSYTEEL